MLSIGRGFNSATNQVKPSSVFSSSIKAETRADNRLSYYSSVYRTSDDYKKNFSNSFKLDVPTPVPNTANLNLALNVAHDIQQSNTSLVYVMRIVLIGKREDLVEVSSVLSDPKTQSELKGDQKSLANFYDKYGDSYVTSISYGKEIAITIEFKNSNVETTKKINTILNLGLRDIQMEDIAALSKIVKDNNLQSRVNIKSTGFKNYQLPPILPKTVADLTDWLKLLQNKFKGYVASDFTEQLEYEVTPYIAILSGAELDVAELSMKTLLLSQYLSRIQKCRLAIAGYFEYYEYLGNSDQILTYLQLYKQKLDFIESILRINNNFNDLRVVAAIKSLREIIKNLNRLSSTRISYKLVNKITAADFGSNITDFNFNTKRHISNPFKIDVDPDLVINRFAFKVTNPENKLDGTLGLYYSTSSKVPYDARSQPIASNISIGNSTANVPEDLFAKGIQNMFFGYHYYGSVSRGFNIKKPLQIETIINYKIPEQIYIDDTEYLATEVRSLKKLTSKPELA